MGFGNYAPMGNLGMGQMGSGDPMRAFAAYNGGSAYQQQQRMAQPPQGIAPILRGAGQYQNPGQIAAMSQAAQQAAPQQMPGAPSWMQKNRGLLGGLGMQLMQGGQRGGGGLQGLLAMLQRGG